MASGLAKAAQIISNDTDEQYQTVIRAFYGEYSPIRYHRYDSLYNTSDRVAESSSTSLRAGITLNPGATETNHDSPEYVFVGAFGMGIHGTSSIMVGTPGRTTMDSWYEHYKGWLPVIVRSCIHIGR